MSPGGPPESGGLTLRGSVVVVTGASRGIGRAICQAFARAGADIVAAARSTEGAPSKLPGTLEAVLRDVEATGARAVAVRTDVTNVESIAYLARRTVELFGRADVLVNNAAYMVRAPFAEAPSSRWERVLDVTLLGAVRCTRAFLPDMIARGVGRIINVSSGAAVMSLPDMSSYMAAKAALEAFTRGLAAEVNDRGVAVNALRIDRAVMTEGALAVDAEGDHDGWETPEAIAGAALWLARQDVAFTGQIVVTSEVQR